MRGRKRRRVGHELGIDRRADQLRERHQLGMRPALRHRVAGDDHRALGGGEHVGGRFDRRPITPQPRRDTRRRHQIELAFRLEDVARQRQEHRPGRRRQRGFGGAMHHPRQILDASHLVRPFDERPRQARQVGRQDRLGDDEFLVLLSGRDQDRRGRLLGVVQHAHGVAETRRDMEVRDRELAGRLRVTVRHRHDAGLLQAEHVAQLVLGRERVHQRQLGGAGIAEQDLDAFLLQELQEGTLSGHDGQTTSSNWFSTPPANERPSRASKAACAAERDDLTRADCGTPWRPPQGRSSGRSVTPLS